MKITLELLVALLIFISANELGYWIVDLSGVPIPGNVVGMLLVFILLLSGVLPLSRVERLADFLLKHLAFFFIPIAVGLMAYGSLLAENGFTILIALVIGLAAGVVVMCLLNGRSIGGEKG
ncbi:MAG: CidA/LrgA family protein [Bacilli bacterium]